MFTKARIKLTAWYLAIIMAISLSFSGVIYVGVNNELTRFDDLQRARQERTNEISQFLRNNGFPVPPEAPVVDTETLQEARLRILSVLGLVDLSILVIAGIGGYFLAGRTLDPIRKNVEEQKAFISDASHELRTPLTSLKTEIEVSLRDKKLNLPDARALLKSNLEDVNKMQKLANYLLKMNRYEEGNGFTLSKIDLKDVALKAIGKMDVKTDLKKSVVMGNEDSLIELIAILLDNAFKYSTNGGEVTVKVRDGKIEVSDLGVGIPKEDIPHIFDRFYRSDKSRGTDGYGLGLSIAKSIVDLNKGTIRVVSKLNKGTTFVVQL